ncbi:MAG: hypothetical protein JST80_06770 [Bdellovibrionales bacterium]|nr:hypothetical protein [Bdellovibrionales bacterium]
MAMDMDSGDWIPLVEFSVQKGISLSTLRRYIKANKIPWKLVDGRYLVMDDGTFSAPRNHDPKGVALIVSHDHLATNVEERIQNLESALSAANEEIAELKTLVAFYEEKWSLQSKK